MQLYSCAALGPDVKSAHCAICTQTCTNMYARFIFLSMEAEHQNVAECSLAILDIHVNQCELELASPRLT